MQNVSIVVLLAFVIAFAIGDVRTHRIPNELTVSAAVLAVVLGASGSGMAGAITAINGFLVGFAVFLPLYLSNGLGAGDVKAMAAAGAFLGAQGALIAVALTLVIGGFFGLLVLVLLGGHQALRALVGRWMRRLVAVVATGNPAAATSKQLAPADSDAATRRFPYGIAIACGSIAAAAWLGRLQPLLHWSH